MSKHIFTPNGNTPLFVNAANGALRFMFPAPERFTISNSDVLRIDDFFEPYIMPDGTPGFWSGLRPETESTPALYLKKRVYPTGLGSYRKQCVLCEAERWTAQAGSIRYVEE